MQPPYPPPYGQPPYGQQPYGQQPQPWNVGPPQPVDPLKVPLRLIMGGLAVGILSSAIGLVVNGRFYLGALSRYGFPLIGYAGLALLIAGAAVLGSKKQPGHQLALAAAAVYAVDLLFVMFAPSSSYESHLPPQTMMVISLFGKLLAAGAISALAVSLLQLGRARGRSIDVAAFATIGVTALSVVVSLAVSVLGRTMRYAGGVDLVLLMALLLGVLSLVARAILIMATAGVAEGPVAPGNVQGSFILGFLAGFFGGCLGLGLVFAIAKGAQTKRGASIGFSAQVFAGILLNGLRH